MYTLNYHFKVICFKIIWHRINHLKASQSRFQVLPDTKCGLQASHCMGSAPVLPTQAHILTSLFSHCLSSAFIHIHFCLAYRHSVAWVPPALSSSRLYWCGSLVNSPSSWLSRNSGHSFLQRNLFSLQDYIRYSSYMKTLLFKYKIIYQIATSLIRINYKLRMARCFVPAAFRSVFNNGHNFFL